MKGKRLVALSLAAMLGAGCPGPPPSGGLRTAIDAAPPRGRPGHFESSIEAEDGVLLYAQGWRPHGDPKASVVIVHGLRDHGGRYAPLARELTKRGWAVYAADLRGHGRSQGRRVTVDRFSRYVEDLSRVIDRVAAWRGEDERAPLFLMGHSMGGTIASLYAELPSAKVDGLILSAPALVTFASTPEVCGANLLADLDPFAPRLAIEMANWSRAPKVVHDNLHDPLVYQPGAPVATGAMLIEASAQALDEAPYVRVPTLLMHGSADRITDPAGSSAFLARIRSSDKTLKLYPGLYHDLWHEPERDTLIADLAAWLEARDRSEAPLADGDCDECDVEAEERP